MVVFTLCFLGLIAAAEWLYESVLIGRMPEPLAHGLKIFCFALIFLYLRNALSGILGGQRDPVRLLWALPVLAALVVVFEVIRAFFF